MPRSCRRPAALLGYIGGECLARAKAQWAGLLDPERLAGVPIGRPGNEFERMTDELDEHIRTALERLLRARPADVGAASPRLAARVGVLMLDATIRESVLFTTDRDGPLAVADAKLRRELARAFAAYLAG